jgi:hypothetical protein
VVYVRSAPPPTATEVVAVAPGTEHVYVRGHWEWDGARYAWVHSHYVKRPYPHATWVEAHWQDSPHGWYWQPGHWAERHPGKAPALAAIAPSGVQGSPSAPPQVEPQGDAAAQLPAGVPPAPTYVPPPPPANPPPPPAAAPVPQSGQN